MLGNSLLPILLVLHFFGVRFSHDLSRKIYSEIVHRKITSMISTFHSWAILPTLIVVSKCLCICCSSYTFVPTGLRATKCTNFSGIVLILGYPMRNSNFIFKITIFLADY